MKYVKISVLAVVICLMILLDLWLEYNVVLPLWQIVGIIFSLAIILYLYRKWDERKQEDIELELGTKLTQQDNLRFEAEDYILGSGDEEAISILNRAKANRHSYIRILSEGRDKGNKTVAVALGILTGIFKNNANPSIDDNSIPEAIDKMASDFFEVPLKKEPR